jgi:hypothetical protein
LGGAVTVTQLSARIASPDDFFSVNGNVLWRADSQLHALAMNRDHGQFDVPANYNSLAGLSA